MAINNFPPQAYTRETLSAAYEWLSSQPPSIRELAKDSDSLVALYLQYRRRGMNVNTPATHTAPLPGATLISTDAPSHSFSNDLKVLAEGLKQFEDAKRDKIIEDTKRELAAELARKERTSSVYKADVVKTETIKPENPKYETHRAENIKDKEDLSKIDKPAEELKREKISDLMGLLDQKSQNIIFELQMKMNLSSPQEALRMLIVLGFDKIRDHLPR